jgi:hypothetical protein
VDLSIPEDQSHCLLTWPTVTYHQRRARDTVPFSFLSCAPNQRLELLQGLIRFRSRKKKKKRGCNMLYPYVCQFHMPNWNVCRQRHEGMFPFSLCSGKNHINPRASLD